jgi:hypothetical protein
MRLQQATPFRNDTSPLWKMVDRIDAGNRVETAIGKRQSFRRIHNVELCPFFGQLPGCG